MSTNEKNLLAALLCLLLMLLPASLADDTMYQIPTGTVSIEDESFMDRDDLQTVVITDDVESIGARAFYGCDALRVVLFPDSVSSIGEDAFAGCPELTLSVPAGSYAQQYCIIDNGLNWKAVLIGDTLVYEILEDSKLRVDLYTGTGGEAHVPWVFDGYEVSTIGAKAFYGNNSVINVDLPDSITAIEDEAFALCTDLTDIRMPYDLQSIGDHAFQDCSGMTGVSIPCGVTSVGNDAFSGCAALKTVFYDGTQEQKAAMQIGSGNEPLLAAAWQLIDHILVLPAGIARIESEAFAGLPEVQGVCIPITVSSIAADAFDHAVVIYAPAGSYAAQWAISNGYELVEE